MEKVKNHYFIYPLEDESKGILVKGKKARDRTLECPPEFWKGDHIGYYKITVVNMPDIRAVFPKNICDLPSVLHEENGSELLKRVLQRIDESKSKFFLHPTDVNRNTTWETILDKSDELEASVLAGKSLRKMIKRIINGKDKKVESKKA